MISQYFYQLCNASDKSDDDTQFRAAIFASIMSMPRSRISWGFPSIDS